MSTWTILPIVGHLYMVLRTNNTIYIGFDVAKKRKILHAHFPNIEKTISIGRKIYHNGLWISYAQRIGEYISQRRIKQVLISFLPGREEAS